MEKKQKDDSFYYLFGLLGLIILSIFLINTICIYQYYNRKYDFSQASARVTDTWNFFRFLPAILVLGLFCFLFINFWSGARGNHIAITSVDIMIFLVMLAITVLFPFILLSARLGTTQAGLLIFKDRGYFVIPTDWNKNTFFENIFQLKIITSMFTMEQLALAGIKKITRESGKTAFVHGDFGTRKITWRNKQKRDECIAALESACGRRLGSR